MPSALPLNSTEHLYLLGYMGAGKSRVGPLLARKMGRPFLDMDKQIEKLTGVSIPQLFMAKGEAYFRKMETVALRATAHLSKAAVIATGGGAPCFEDNLSIMRNHGKTLYLQVRPEILVRRLESVRSDRPLLPGEGKLQKYIEQHLAERRIYYEAADGVLKAEDTPDEVVRRILKMLS